VGNARPTGGCLGVSPQVVKAWEQGRRLAAGAVRRLLADMRDHSGHWRDRVREVIIT